MHVLSLQPVCDRLALETNYIKFVNNIFHVFSLAISSKHCWGVFYHYLSETGYIVHSSACSTLTVLRHSEAGLILGSELFASFCLNASSHIIDDPFRSWPQWLSFLFAAPHRPNAHRCFFYFYLSFFFLPPSSGFFSLFDDFALDTFCQDLTLLVWKLRLCSSRAEPILITCIHSTNPHFVDDIQQST